MDEKDRLSRRRFLRLVTAGGLLALRSRPAGSSEIARRPAQAALRTSHSAPEVTFAAVGDVPYNERQEQLLRRSLDETNQDPAVEFVIHLGDITCGMGCPGKCGEDQYARVADLLRASAKPVFIIPGDNEWNDCIKGGLAEVDSAWSYWTKYFMRFESNWSHPFRVSRQRGREENFAFPHKGVLFVGINMVGGVPDIPSKSEWTRRLSDASEWTAQNLSRSRADLRAAVIFGHAQPDPLTNLPKKEHLLFFESLRRAALEFGKPTLYLHGDGHRFERQTGFLGVPNLYRVGVDGDDHFRRHLKITLTHDPADWLLLDRGL